MSKLLDSYLIHRSATELQKLLLEDNVVVLPDFKELFTLFVRSVQTGDVDHTSRASQCIDHAPKQRRRKGKARSTFCRTLVRVCGPIIKLKCAKHFKSEADRPFALFEQYVKDARNEIPDLLLES